jgi:uncharacterized protein YPO0396
VAHRVAILQKKGFDDKLRSMMNDPCLDVRDRVKTAIEHFDSFYK